LQLPVVSITLFIESFELDNAESCLCKALGVVFGPLANGGGKSSAVAWMVAVTAKMATH